MNLQKISISGNKKTSLVVGLIGIILICLISICCIEFIFSDPIGASTLTPFLIPVDTIIAGTSSAARFQTLSAASPIPSSSIEPSLTLIPTWTSIPTFTQVVLSTQIFETLPVVSVCACDYDQYDCKDFTLRAQAQACFDNCISQGHGDIHRLDENNNNIACESLP